MQELLAQHNLDLGDIQDSDDGDMSFAIMEDGRPQNWKSRLLSSLAVLYFCHMIHSYTGTRTKKLKLVGRNVNVKVCKMTYEYLIESIDRLTKDMLSS